MTGRIAAVLAMVGWAAAVCAADPARPTVIWDDVATEVAAAPAASPDLWVTTADLTRATGFVIKKQGVCRDELCFPISRSRKAEFLADRAKATWFNLSAFARLLKQPIAHDETLAVWFFGPRLDQQSAWVSSLRAPDFTLPDLAGQKHSLADFRGRKVLLVTWASW